MAASACNSNRENDAPSRQLGSSSGALYTATGAMIDARSNFQAVKLLDGRVLVAGGKNNLLDGPWVRAELFDPSTGQFSATGSMTAGRYGHAAVLLPNGKVFVSGGLSPSNAATLWNEVYDPSTGTWSVVGSDVARYLLASATLADGRILLVGGASNDGYTIGTAHLIDPSTLAASATGSLITARYAHRAVTLDDGRVLVCGGSDANGTMLASAEIFDPASGAWTATGSMLVGRMMHTLTKLSNGKILAAGGSTDSSAEIYDPASGTWTSTGALGAPRRGHAATLTPAGRVLVFGGYGSSGVVATVERYEPSTGVWSLIPSMGQPRAWFGMTTLADGRYLLTGGFDDSTVLSSATLYTEEVCNPTSCGAQGAVCGTISDGCGGTLSCGSCDAGEVCTSSFACCAPMTCEAQGASCGSVGDGCGGTLACGNCGAGEVCTPGSTCCAPTTCEAQGASCGSVTDGCGGTLACGSCSPGLSCSNNVCIATPGSADYDATLKVPRCTGATPFCDSGILLNGRAGLGPELNSPNSIKASCSDGTSGAYHSDESLDRLKISSVDGSDLLSGKPATIEAMVWVFAASVDKLDLYYAADAQNPTWTFITTLTPSASGAQTLSATYTLPSGALQAIRGVFRYNGTAGPCPGGPYTDVDDLVFAVTQPPDMAAPTTALTAPTAGQMLAATVVVTASASDDIAVTKVEFYDGDNLLSTDSTAPYTYYWNTRTVPNGTHTLTSRAYDASGRVGVSTPINVATDNDFTPPIVNITAPADGSTLSGSVNFAAAATDNLVVNRIELYVDGVYWGTCTSQPCSSMWSTTTVSNGSHVLTAKAYDGVGNSATSPVVTVVSNNDKVPPAVVLTSPVNGASVSGLTELVANASDDVGVSSVTFYVDGTYVNFASATTSPYNAYWNSATVANGTHSLTAKAYDAAGNSTTSAAVLVTVNNVDTTAPITAITSPTGGAILRGAVTLAATASDDVGVNTVEFYDGATLLGSTSIFPYQWAWDTTSAASGSHTLATKAYDLAGNVGVSAAVAVTVNNAAGGVVTASYDATRRAPRCGALASGCDSGALLNGRASLGPEANAPNTLNGSCADGNSGTYHSDESLDRLKITTVDGSILAPGKQVRIDATVWAYASYTSDKLDFYYAADATAPVWTYLTTLTPAAAGSVTLTSTYTLPTGALQAIRGVFRYGGSAGACTAGVYDDHDDLVFPTQ